MRRNRDRRLKRIRQFAEKLVEFGLVAAKGVAGREKYKTGSLDMKKKCSIYNIDPYAARSNAAQKIVGKDELARALFHLCKRRGFLSNRKTDGEDKDVTERKANMKNLATLLEKEKITLGQYLYNRLQAGKHIRFRGAEFDKDENSEKIAIYPTRAMYVQEFEKIREVQGNQYLSNEQWDELFNIFSFQRPLMAQKVGVCTFEHGRDGREEHPRASRHLPLAHTFRIIQEVNNLRYQTDTGEIALSPEQRKILYDTLEHKKSMTFNAIHTALKLNKTQKFNLESNRRNKLLGNATACEMRAIFEIHEHDWDSLEADIQNDIVQTILDANNLEDFLIVNREQGWNFPAALIRELSKKYYSSSHGHISLQCMKKLIPLMREGKQYWEAAREIYGDHTDYSQFATGEVLDELPYYGEVLRGATSPVRVTAKTPEDEKLYGKIANPTVHVALNQLRKLINALLKRYGSPYEIHLELAREVKTAGKKYKELLKKLGENTEENEKRRKKLEENGQESSGLNILKLKLWEELAEAGSNLGRLDVYTGRAISFAQLLSDEIEIEHILPYSRTYDNAKNNLTVTFRDVNRRKKNILPYDFALSDPAIDPEEMLLRTQSLPKGKRWRFQKDAAQIYEQIITKNMSHEERKEYDADNSGGFIARQLVDTKYISRIAARYLVPVVGEPSRVIPVNGHITNRIRQKWNINALKAKGEDTERQDHRHHAEDALIVALASKGLLKSIADETRAKQEERKDYRAKLKFPQRPQWVTDAKIKEVADRINVSFRENHSREAKLYTETAYGILPPDDPWAKQHGFNAVVRRAIVALKENEKAQIRDDTVRLAIDDFLKQPEIKAISKWADKMAKLAQTKIQIGKAKNKVRIRAVRIGITNQSITRIPSASYKGYSTDSIAFCDIWHTPVHNKKGKFTGKWKYVGKYVNYVDALRFDGNEEGLYEKYKPHPAAKKIMRVFKNDMVFLKVEDEEKNITWQLTRIAGFSTTDNKLDVRPHTESESKQKFKTIPVLMEKMSMQKVRVSVDGRIF